MSAVEGRSRIQRGRGRTAGGGAARGENRLSFLVIRPRQSRAEKTSHGDATCLRAPVVTGRPRVLIVDASEVGGRGWYAASGASAADRGRVRPLALGNAVSARVRLVRLGEGRRAFVGGDATTQSKVAMANAERREFAKGVGW